MRLILWILLPPFIITGIGLSAYALRLQAEWEQNRTTLLSKALPRLDRAQQNARALLTGFRTSEAYSIRSEDDLIAYIRDIERKSDFTIETLEVKRKDSGKGRSVLIAQVRGVGRFGTIEKFISDAVTGQYLLYESRIEIRESRGLESSSSDQLGVSITFELILLDSLKSTGGRGE